MAIATGDRAPEFDLEEAVDQPRVRLSDYRGRSNVLLVFHPFAFTPVCTEEAQDLQENLASFRNANTEIVFVSCDTSAARQAWKAELGAEYTFASDFWSHGTAAKDYGVFNEETGAPHRGTFLIDRDGVVIWSLVGRPGQAPDGDGAGLARHAPRRRVSRPPASRSRHEAGTDTSPVPGYRDSRGASGPLGGAWTETARRTPPVTRTLHVHAWGAEGAPTVVCLHGVTAWGGHFERLATALAATHRVVAPDLLGHGASPWEPPWRIADHLDALEATLGDEPATWIGHSFGARLSLEQAARRPGSVERLVLLDPAIVVPPHVALWAAENARAERRYASFDEAIERRFAESQLHDAPRALVEDELRGHLVEDDDGLALPLRPGGRRHRARRSSRHPLPTSARPACRLSSSTAPTRTSRTTCTPRRIGPRSATCSRS